MEQIRYVNISMYAKLREDSLDYKQLLVSNFFQLKGIIDRS